MLDSIAFILPRYARSIGGGAETLAKALIDNLPAANVEVWTTCALDHRTWENELPPGPTEVDGVPVKRFPVSPRDAGAFISAELNIQNGKPLLLEEQLDWLANSVNSTELYAHIASEGVHFDALVFAPYLFATSFWGPLIYPEKSILIPCLHNESYAYLEVFRHLFSKVRGVLYNAQAEAELAAEIYALPELRGAVVGMGFDVAPVAKALPEKFNLTEQSYLLYSGRKEEGKNLHLLIDYFERYESDLKLVLIGAGDINFRETLPEGVIDLGFVSEDEKLSLMASALVLCQPSVNESFSIVMMEAWQQGLPSLVHANCAVTRSHVTEASGGLYFANYDEFVRALDMLTADLDLRKSLGLAGKEYVAQKYSWPAVLSRLEEGLEFIRKS